FAHGTLDDAALGVFAHEVGEGIAIHLLDAERNTLALRIHGQNHSLDLVTLLVVAHRLFARQIPGDVGQVHQTVDAAFQAHEDAEVGDRLDGARDAVVLVVQRTELVPGIGVALFHAERDAATLLVDV